MPDAAGVDQTEIERAAGPAAGEAAAAGGRDSGDPAAAGKDDIQLRRMAGYRILFAFECGVERAVADERDAVVRLGSIQPRLHGRGDVDDDVILGIRRGDVFAGGDEASEGGGIAECDGLFRPGAGDVVDIERATASHAIEVELQGSLSDVGAGVAGGDRRQVKLNVGRLRSAVYIQITIATVVLGRSQTAGGGVGARRNLRISAGQQAASRKQQHRQPRLQVQAFHGPPQFF